MTGQLDLHFSNSKHKSIDDRFSVFHRDNPHIFGELVKLALQARAAGRQHIGIRMLWERMRWTFTVETRRADGDPKLNDHFTSRYARMIMEHDPKLVDLFETRELRS